MNGNQLISHTAFHGGKADLKTLRDKFVSQLKALSSKSETFLVKNDAKMTTLKHGAKLQAEFNTMCTEYSIISQYIRNTDYFLRK